MRVLKQMGAVVLGVLMAALMYGLGHRGMHELMRWGFGSEARYRQPKIPVVKYNGPGKNISGA